MFTDEEIQAAVEQLVSTSVRRPYDDTGVRRTDITFSDLTDAAAGVFVLYPNSLYYIVKLCVDKTSKLLEANQELLNTFTSYVSVVGRHVRPVSTLNALANARVALQELASASSTRGEGFRDITDTSAYARFDENTQRFLDEVGGAVRSGGDIVPTPDEARGQFASSYTALKEGFDDIVVRVDYLLNAVDDFDGMNLPATLFGNIADNSRALLQSEYDKLDALTPEERLKYIRNTILNVLATRSTVRGFGSMSSPGMFYELEGDGGPHASTDYPAEAAAVEGDVYSPFPILGTENELNIRLDGDGSPTTTVYVQPSFVPFLNGMAKEYFNIDPTPPTDNSKVTIGLKNWPLGSTTLVDVDLSPAGAYSAWEVCYIINSAIQTAHPLMPLIAEPYANPQRYQGNFDAAIDGLSNWTFTTTNPLAVDFVALGVVAGDRVIVRDVTSSMNRSIFLVLSVAPDSLYCSNVYGASLNESDITAIVSNGALAINLRITDQNDSDIPLPDYRLQALIDRVAIVIPQIGAGTTDDQFYGATVLGFVPLMEVTARPTPAADVVTGYNAQPSAAVNGVARTSASASFYPTMYIGAGRTNPYDPLVLIAVKYASTADVTAGISATFTCTDAPEGVSTGDTIVVRSSVTPANVGVKGVVDTVSNNIITTTMDSALVADTAIDVEVGPTLTNVLDATLMVSGYTADDGEYTVRSQGAIPFELTVDKPVPVPYGVGNLPITCTFELGRYVMKFSSLEKGLTAQIYMSSEANPSSAYFDFFTYEPTNMHGMTYYYELPVIPKGLSEGDMLELYTTPNLQPSYVGTIESIDEAARVIKLDTELAVNTASMPFDKSSPVPFARIRRLHADNYVIFADSLAVWSNMLNLDQNFMDLGRALNVLLVNKNPTPSQVNDARNELIELSNTLLSLQLILDSYTAPVVEQVDTLVKSFYEKGADRAVDILLDCRFSDFFGLSQDGGSYASYVQSAIRDVANKDLPVRKFDRLNKNKAGQALLASWDEQDFEFSKGMLTPSCPTTHRAPPTSSLGDSGLLLGELVLLVTV